eukprot:751172_1
MILSATLWFAFITTIINGHNHEVVMIVDNSLRLPSSECIEQQTAISNLFKGYANISISNDVSYISFSHYQPDFTKLISFKDIQNDTKSIQNLASKIKKFDCNQHILTNKIKNIHYNNSFNQLLNVLKYAISSYQNHTKTKRILLFNNFATSTKSQEEICEYFIQNNKQNLHMDIKYEPNTFNHILGLVSINIMGHGVDNNYLKCDKIYIKKNITLNNSSLTTFNAKHDEIFYAICVPADNGTCNDCIINCAWGASAYCSQDTLDTCKIITRCAEKGTNGGPVCCGSGLVDACCEYNGVDAVCTETPTTEFCCVRSVEPTLTPTAFPTSVTSNPTSNPTVTPTIFPTVTPTIFPTVTPTIFPTGLTSNPSVSPTNDGDNDNDNDDSSASNDNAMIDVNVVDGLNGNNEMNGPKSKNVRIKLDSLTTVTVWMIIGMVTFCLILICCVCKRKTKQRQFEPDTI